MSPRKPLYRILLSGLRILFTVPIWIYQKVISPWLPASCIYTPSCSEYAKQAVLKHGLLKGMLAGILRISRCTGILFCGGPDEVPEQFSFKYIFSRFRFFRYSKKSK
jgi:uncharacterized protein